MKAYFKNHNEIAVEAETFEEALLLEAFIRHKSTGNPMLKLGMCTCTGNVSIKGDEVEANIPIGLETISIVANHPKEDTPWPTKWPKEGP
jgi:hypothetical protein